MKFEGTIVSIFIDDKRRFVKIELNDPRYDFFPHKQDIVLKDDNNFSLGDKVTLEVS